MIRHEDIDDGPLYSKWHKVCCFPCLIPCNFLFHPCRKAVSGKKKRWEKEGFDLDLVYLSPRIIIHGFPSHGLEHIYRNPRYEIRRFLDTRHKDKYKMYNFCCEYGRGYSPDVFYGRVERYPFKDHNTPPLETMAAFANSCKYWMDQDPENVCSMHCKAGKGRAGVMSCVALIRSGHVQSAKGKLKHRRNCESYSSFLCYPCICHALITEAIELYDRDRVKNNKGLTITSQRKFVIFYEALWRDHWRVSTNIGDVPGEQFFNTQWVVPSQPELRLNGIEIVNVQSNVLRNVRVRVYKGTNFAPVLLHDSGKGQGDGLSFDCDCSIQGNFKVGVEYKIGAFSKPIKVFELWHNTLFMET
jgi:phosphatidylinositol-3,4,5-trisphosphate 3-phosphatase and dual-specificity protein phosphatase PTEN